MGEKINQFGFVLTGLGDFVLVGCWKYENGTHGSNVNRYILVLSHGGVMQGQQGIIYLALKMVHSGRALENLVENFDWKGLFVVLKSLYCYYRETLNTVFSSDSWKPSQH